MGVHESSKGRSNVPNKMTRDRSGSDYSENMSDVTTCSCTATSSVDKCSLRGCGMFQEPFFLHPPGSRPRDGIYINPMSAYISEPSRKPKESESFYLHSPRELVYTRIAHLFADADNRPRNGVVEHRQLEKKDETLTVKVDVHVNNNRPVEHKTVNGNGLPPRTDIVRDTVEHAYEQICIRQDEVSSVGSSSNKKSDTVSESSRSRKTGRRYSRSSSTSESSSASSELHCFSSSTSTPSLSRTSSNERIKNLKINADIHHDKTEATPAGSSRMESEKEIRPSNVGSGLVKPPPPPPPPPPDRDDTIVLVVSAKQTTTTIATIVNGRDEKRDGAETKDTGSEHGSASSAANRSERPQPEVGNVSPSADVVEEIKTNQQTSHHASRHMVLPFVLPKFANADSDTLLKPSEYLKSICKSSVKSSLSKARSVDNLDIQGHKPEVEDTVEETCQEPENDTPTVTVVETKPDVAKEPSTIPGPPPPPLTPLQKIQNGEAEGSKNPQPLATISIQDLASIQLRRTATKMNATKTFSAPPPRSVSMTNVSEPFFVQKTDLIAELKRTKDIPGIKKSKVERAQVEKTQEQNLKSEITKAFSASNFVDQIPEKDSSGNTIPIWKRQMLARKAAERAKKELEEQIARENEEKRQKAIPPWKRQLLAKKDSEEKRTIAMTPIAPAAPAAPPNKIETTPTRDASPSTARVEKREEPAERDEKRNEMSDSDDGPIIPWRAQLRKTNSKLNILD